MRHTLSILAALAVSAFCLGCGGSPTPEDQLSKELQVSTLCNWNRSAAHVSAGVYSGQSDQDLLSYCRARMTWKERGTLFLYLYDSANPWSNSTLMGWKDNCGKAVNYVETQTLKPVVTVISEWRPDGFNCTVERN